MNIDFYPLYLVLNIIGRSQFESDLNLGKIEEYPRPAATHNPLFQSNLIDLWTKVRTNFLHFQQKNNSLTLGRR